MKNLNFRKKVEAFPAKMLSTADRKGEKTLGLGRRFVEKTKKLFKHKQNHTPAPVSLPEHYEELTFQSVSTFRAPFVVSSSAPLASHLDALHTVVPRQASVQHHATRDGIQAPSHAQNASFVFTDRDSNISLLTPPPGLEPRSCRKAVQHASLVAGQAQVGAWQTTENVDDDKSVHGRRAFHRRLKSNDADASFFFASESGSSSQDAVAPVPPLSYEQEDRYNLSTVSVLAEKGNVVGCVESVSARNAVTSVILTEKCVVAKLPQEITIGQGSRDKFAAGLEGELIAQKLFLEAAFEKCYGIADQVHKNEILDLREDHEAELAELTEVRIQRDMFRKDNQILRESRAKLKKELQVFMLENQRLERAAEEIGRMERVLPSTEVKSNELLAGASQVERAPTGRFQTNERAQVIEPSNERRSAEIRSLEKELESVGLQSYALGIQNGDLAKRLAHVTSAYEELEKQNAPFMQHPETVTERKVDYRSSHTDPHKSPLTLCSKDRTPTEAYVAGIAACLNHGESDKFRVLQGELTRLESSKDAQLLRNEQVIDQISSALISTSCRLKTVSQEKAELEVKYDALLKTLVGNMGSDKTMRNLRNDLQAAITGKQALESALSQARREVWKAEQNRREQVCDLRDEMQEKNEELASLKLELKGAEMKIAAHEYSVHDVWAEQRQHAVLEMEALIPGWDAYEEMRAEVMAEETKQADAKHAEFMAAFPKDDCMDDDFF